MDGDGRDDVQTGGPLDASDDSSERGATHRGAQPVQADDVGEHVVELRHEAGLTAGHTLGLRPGKFRLGPRRSSEGGLVTGAPEIVSFDLVIDPNGRTTLHAGGELVAVEGVVVDRPVHIDHGDVIQLTTDHFVLRSLTATRRRRSGTPITPRTVPPPFLPSMAGWLWFFGAVALFGFILGFVRSSLFGLVLIGLGGVLGTLVVRSRRHDRARSQHSTQLSNARSLFFNDIIDSRKAAAEGLRSEANTPATVAHRATQPSQKTGPRLYATVASGDRSWMPPVLCHRHPGWDHQQLIDELSFLPAIPFTIDFDAGPVALVGPRLATLAVARHVATTVLVASPHGTGVRVTTTVPADWRWLHPAEQPALHILDGAEGPLEPRTVVIAPSLDSLADIDAFSHVVHLLDDGKASIRQTNGDISDGFTPHGITEKQAAHIVASINGPEPTIDLRQSDLDVFDSTRLLVTGSDLARNRNVLATAALRQAALHPHRSIFVLDRGDRALIRLAQLEACHRYVAIDQVDHVEAMLGELEAIETQPSEMRVLLLAPELWEATAFYRNSGRVDLADRLDALVGRMELLPVAASAAGLERVPRSAFLVWVNTEGNELAEVHLTGPDLPQSSTLGLPVDQLRTLDLTSLPGIDLTASVARFTTSSTEEPSA